MEPVVGGGSVVLVLRADEVKMGVEQGAGISAVVPGKGQRRRQRVEFQNERASVVLIARASDEPGDLGAAPAAGVRQRVGHRSGTWLHDPEHDVLVAGLDNRYGGKEERLLQGRSVLLG